MGLIVPAGPGFAHATAYGNFAPGAQYNVGLHFTPGASNADSTVTDIGSTLAYDTDLIVGQISDCNASGVDTAALLDIGYDPAGGTSFNALLSDWVFGFVWRQGSTFYIPVRVKNGSSILYRARCAASSPPGGVYLRLLFYSKARLPHTYWVGSGIETLGVTAATSKGTTVTPGSSGTFGSWATIGTSTRRYGMLQFAINGTGSTMAAKGYYWQVGIGSAQIPGTPTFSTEARTDEMICSWRGPQQMSVDIPANTAIQVRATCSGASPDNHNVAVYGTY